MRKLRGKDVQITHGLAESLLQLEGKSKEFRQQVAEFIDRLVSHYVLDDGKLVVAHAGMKEQYQGRGSARVREFALYGETTGETDELGLPIRQDWASEYRGNATVVYGHTPVTNPEWLNRTINIDTGCVFGGSLTALRYPEREMISVPALHTYAQPVRPLRVNATAVSISLQQLNDDVLDLEDVIGKRVVQTRLMASITVREENAIAALEVISRFAVNPKWLIYLPPTMSPTETSQHPNLLEHPTEAFAYYRANGIGQVICEQKHMGSRAIIIVCRDESVALKRFGIDEAIAGIIYTRTGRRFFDDAAVERELLLQIRNACTNSRFWEKFDTDWFCFDTELMPWSAKAQELLKTQYAAVASAAKAGLSAAVDLLRETASHNSITLPDTIQSLLEHYQQRQANIDRYVAAYREYCWPVHSIADLRVAPFHLLASEGKTHIEQSHLWHTQTLAQLASSGSPTLLATRHCMIDLTDPASEQAGVDWWLSLTSAGGEGMVVKPLDWITRGPRGLVQPAIKCRGPEYLRIIYGPEYNSPANITRLKSRKVFAKRSLAIREFALGIESLERFIRTEPLRRVHECVFAVLAMESEPIDARL